MLILLFAFHILLVQLQLSDSAFCNSSPDDGERTNDYEVYDGMESLEFVKKVDNGMLYTAGPTNARFPIVHVYGDPYEMGYAEGLLVKEELKIFSKGAFAYLEKEILNEFGDMIPKSLQAIIASKGLDAALDWTAKVTDEFTPSSYYEQLHGLADASGIDFQFLLRINMMPELTKASCSFFGAWGKATENINSGSSVQLRALDYVTDSKAFTDFPQVTIYHPKDGVAHAAVSWPGVVGILTGFSANKLGISEIGVSFADDTFGQGTDDTPPEKVHGQPWMSVLKDILYYDNSLDDATKRLESANRTCNLIIGVGDGNNNMVNGFEYSGYVLNPYDDTNLIPVNDTWHSPIENVVYNGMDWDCPSYTEKLGEQLNKYWGSINDDRTISDILPTVQTGDLHIAVYDLTNSKMSVSFCKRSNAADDEPTYAYERQFTRFDMNKLFEMTTTTTKNDEK